MNFMFIPLYIKYLGIEAYGLIGFFAILQAWLALLQLGLRPSVSREMARFLAGTHTAASIRELLRSIEVIVVVPAGCVAVGVWASAPWLATQWLRNTTLSPVQVEHAIATMGLVSALSLIEGLYASCVIGLQRQVLNNVLASSMATVRALGAVGILAFISPTIDAFFWWQMIASVASIVFFGAAVYRYLPRIAAPTRFSIEALRAIWRFAAGMVTITFLSLLLSQIDKVLLSKFLTLRDFAFFTLAGVLANVVYTLGGPVATAFSPRFAELAARRDDAALRKAYHQSSQMMAVAVGAAAVMLIVFSDAVLLLWTADTTITAQTAPLLRLLATGTLLHALMWIPQEVQLSHGWTSLMARTNAVGVAVLLPILVWSAPRYGAIGAAIGSIVLYLGYIVFGVHYMHKRLLREEKRRWYLEDTAGPLIAAAGAALLLRWMIPSDPGRIAQFFFLFLAFSCTAVAAAGAAPEVRRQVLERLRHLLSGGTPGAAARSTASLAPSAAANATVARDRRPNIMFLTRSLDEAAFCNGGTTSSSASFEQGITSALAALTPIHLVQLTHSASAPTGAVPVFTKINYASLAGAWRLLQALRAHSRLANAAVVTTGYYAVEMATVFLASRLFNLRWYGYIYDTHRTALARMPPLKRLLAAAYFRVGFYCATRCRGLLVLNDRFIRTHRISTPYLKTRVGVAAEAGGDTKYAQVHRCTGKQKSVIAFAGTINRENGAILLLDFLRASREVDFEFHIYGDGDCLPELRRAAAEDRRIQYFGRVGADALYEKLTQADFLLNLRDPASITGEYCFPSKLVGFMATGVPVISNEFPGLDSGYSEHLILTEYSVEGLRGTLHALRAGVDRTIGRSARNYVLGHNNWSAIAAELINFMATEPGFERPSVGEGRTV